MRVLFLSDTHLGIDLPERPRVERRRRGDDFFACTDRALEPALAGEADVVVHGGDLLYRSRVSAGLVNRALAPLRRVADAGVPVLVVPGNHERSRIPYPLLAQHPRIHVFAGPATFVVERAGVRVAFAGFPYARGVRDAFPALLESTGYRRPPADVRVLCVHQCVEGATCGPGYVFRGDDEVIRGRDVPANVAAVLSGHVHRQQVLRRDLSGRELGAPVLYAGSVERTSFAERGETKGTLLVVLAPGGRPGGRIVGLESRELPARPMLVHDLHPRLESAEEVEHHVREALAHMPADAVVQLRVPEGLEAVAAKAISAARLRALAPASMNVSVAWPRPWAGTRARSGLP